MPSARSAARKSSTIFDRLLPKGYARESFAGRKANALDAARIGRARRVHRARPGSLLGVPGVSIGVEQDAKVVFAGGFGVRELGKAEKVDAETLYMIASNTKAMTTLMLGTLVDEKKIGWDTRVTSLLPQFKLGNADTTSKVLVRHLICACTGLPRQDFEWLLEFQGSTPATALAVLGTMQPTSDFGALFQYSNALAGGRRLCRRARELPGARAWRRLRSSDAAARLRAARHADNDFRFRTRAARQITPLLTLGTSTAKRRRQRWS